MNDPRSARGDRWPALTVPAVGRRVRARARDRAFTLVELLIGIAILGLLAGVVFASLRPLRDSARTRSGMDRIDSFVRDLRGLALTSGEPVTVVLDPASGRMHGEWLTGAPGARRSGGVTDESDVDVSALSEAGRRASGAAAAGSFDGGGDERRVQEPWAEFVLDRRLELSAMRPEMDETLAMDTAAAARGLPPGTQVRPDFADPVAMFDEAEPVRLVVFMPDGTTLLARPAWLRGVDDALWRMDVHPWTGEPAWSAVQVDPALAGGDESGPPLEPRATTRPSGGGR